MEGSNRCLHQNETERGQRWVRKDGCGEKSMFPGARVIGSLPAATCSPRSTLGPVKDSPTTPQGDFFKHNSLPLFKVLVRLGCHVRDRRQKPVQLQVS